MVRPALFIGSSSEGLRIAEAIQVILDPVCEVELWTQGAFSLTQGTLESLVMALSRFDFALLVLTADDMTISRGTERVIARDNVLFELGLFIGSLSRDRTFMVFDRTNPPTLPSDLAGITAATFAPHVSGNLQAALGAPCAKIRSAVERLGARKDKESRDYLQHQLDETRQQLAAARRQLEETRQQLAAVKHPTGSVPDEAPTSAATLKIRPSDDEPTATPKLILTVDYDALTPAAEIRIELQGLRPGSP